MKRFKKIYIETTNICNLNCLFCPKTKRKPEFMTSDVFEKVIQEVKSFTNHVYFHVMGEPLLNTELPSFLAICESAGIKVNMTTNGTLLKDRGDLLLQSKALRQVNISLSSFEANEMTVALENYIHEVSVFVLQATESGIICSVRLWNMDSESLKGQNQFNSDILELLEKELGLAPAFLSEALQEKNSVKIKEGLYLNMAEKFEWPDLEKEDSQREVFCYGLRDHIGILVDGTVVPCCLDSDGNIPLGNVLETPLEEILQSDRAKRIYEGFSNRTAVEALCQRCGYATRY